MGLNQSQDGKKYGALRYEISKGTRHHHRDGWCSKKPHSSFFAPRCTKLGGIDQQQQQRKFSIANFVALDPPFSQLVVESQTWSKTGGTGLGASHLS